MKTKFFLARHGETQWNKLKKLQGQLDSPLTPTGYNQASELAQAAQPHNIDLIVTSTLPRARLTADVCQQQLGCPLIENEQLIERHFGDWQGKLFESLRQAAHFEGIFFRVTDDAPPNGESGTACLARMSKALIDCAQLNQGCNILVLSHGDALRCFLSQFNTDDFCDAYSQYGNGKMFAVVYHHETQQFGLDNAL
jgi:broad specificity phosphatase PhoE